MLYDGRWKRRMEKKVSCLKSIRNISLQHKTNYMESSKGMLTTKIHLMYEWTNEYHNVCVCGCVFEKAKRVYLRTPHFPHKHIQKYQELNYNVISQIYVALMIWSNVKRLIWYIKHTITNLLFSSNLVFISCMTGCWWYDRKRLVCGFWATYNWDLFSMKCAEYGSNIYFT